MWHDLATKQPTAKLQKGVKLERYLICKFLQKDTLKTKVSMNCQSTHQG